MIGWIKVHRGLMKKGYYSKDSEKVHLWIHILLKASHYEDKEEILGGKPIKLIPGQFTCGRKQLSLETGISESKIERILKYYEEIEQQIEQQKTSTNRCITILNWERYQIGEQQTEQRVNNDRTTSEQRVNTLKEVKKLRNKEDKKNTEKRHLCLFSNSPYFDFEKFKVEFTDPKYSEFNLKFYYESVSDWSASKDKMMVDWIATTRGFMRRDKTEGKVNGIKQFNGYNGHVQPTPVIKRRPPIEPTQQQIEDEILTKKAKAFRDINPDHTIQFTIGTTKSMIKSGEIII